MGALTSKIHVFKNRPWEFQQIKSIDFFDIFGLLIYIDIYGNKINRVLINNNMSDFWLTDKIRFFFDAYYNNRLYYPYIKITLLVKFNFVLVCVLWDDIYDYFFSLKTLLKFILIKINILFYDIFFQINNKNIKIFKFIFKYINFINFFVNENFDFLNGNALQICNKFMNLKVNYNFNNNVSFDFLTNFFFCRELKFYEQIFLLYCNLRVELPNLYFFFLKNLKLKKIKNIFFFGYNIKYNLNFINLGLNEYNFFFRAKYLKKYYLNFLCKYNTLIIFGILFMQRYDFFSLFNLYKKFFCLFKRKEFIFLNQNLVFYSLLLNNFQLNNNLCKVNNFDLFFVINDITYNLLYLEKKKDLNTIFISHHISNIFNKFDLFLPLLFTYEKDNIYLNIFNKFSYSDFLFTPKSNQSFLLKDIIYFFFFSIYEYRYFNNFFFFNLLLLCTFLNNVLFNKIIKIYFFKLLILLLLKQNLCNYIFFFKFFKNLKNFRLNNLKLKILKIYKFFLFKHLNFIYDFFCFDIISQNSLYLNLKKN